MASIKKIMEKIEHQNKVNPGHKSSYEQPLRPRATVFSTKKQYNRQKSKKELKEIINED